MQMKLFPVRTQALRLPALVLVCLLALVSLQVLVLVLVLLAVLLIPVYSPRKRKHA